MSIRKLAASFVAGLMLAGQIASAGAQAPSPPSYGATVNLETAKKIAAAASAEARKNNWNMAIAVVDNHGMLIYYEMADDTQTGSAGVAIEKARTAAIWRRPSKDFEDAVAGGRVAILGLQGVTPIEGGVPIVRGGKFIGGVGASGGASPQDAQVARAGAEVAK